LHVTAHYDGGVRAIAAPSRGTEPTGAEIPIEDAGTTPCRTIRERRPSAAAHHGGGSMNGHVGDRLILKGTHVGDPKRVGVITAVRHADGTPPYEVRWLDSGHEGLVFPGTDAVVEAAPEGGGPRP
jgi:hypothetical protein